MGCLISILRTNNKGKNQTDPYKFWDKIQQKANQKIDLEKQMEFQEEFDDKNNIQQNLLMMIESGQQNNQSQIFQQETLQKQYQQRIPQKQEQQDIPQKQEQEQQLQKKEHQLIIQKQEQQLIIQKQEHQLIIQKQEQEQQILQKQEQQYILQKQEQEQIIQKQEQEQILQKQEQQAIIQKQEQQQIIQKQEQEQILQKQEKQLIIQIQEQQQIIQKQEQEQILQKQEQQQIIQKQEQQLIDINNINDQQNIFENDENKQQQASNQQEILFNFQDQQIEQEIKSTFLRRCFQIDLKVGKVGKINYPSISKVNMITIEYVKSDILQLIVSNKQLIYVEKIKFISKIFNNLAQSVINDAFVQVNEGEIEKQQFNNIVDAVIDIIIKAMISPQQLGWNVDEEDLNNLKNENNFIATLIHKIFFCQNVLNEQYDDPCQNPAVDLLFSYVNQNCKKEEAYKFIDLICKRELFLCMQVNLDDCINQLKAVKLLVKISHYPKIQDCIIENSWAYGRFDQFKTGRELQINSIFGSVLSISTFHRDFPSVKSKYYNRETSLPILMECYRGPIYYIIQQMVSVFLKIIRRGKESQLLLFTYIVKLIEINLNLKRVKQPEEFNKCCFQGMMFNLQQILLEIFNPFIYDFQQAKKRVEKINYKLLSSIKHHPLLLRIYGKEEQISPLKFQFIYENTQPECDPLTFLYLMIQRINSLQQHMILDYVVAYVLYQYDLKIFGRGSNAKLAKESEAEKAAFDTLVLHPNSVKNTLQFLSFQALVAMSLLDKNFNPKYPFGLLASSFFDDMINYSFIYNSNDLAFDYLDEVTTICQFTILSLKYEQLVENIHVRVTGIQIFHIFNQYIQRNSNSSAEKFYKLFSEDKIIQDCLIDGLIKAIVDHDKIKGHELIKENIFMLSVTQLFNYALTIHKNIYEQKLTQYITNNSQIYIKFAFIFINNQKESFDACLKNMIDVKAQETEEQTQQNNGQLQQLPQQILIILAIKKAVLQKELYFSWLFFEESYQNILLFTQIQPQAFMLEETRQQLAENIIYVIEQLLGPSSDQYQSIYREKAKLTPDKAISQIVEFFINFQNHEIFLQQMVQSEGKLKFEEFLNIINKLSVQSNIPTQKLQQFYIIIENLCKLKLENEQIQQSINSNDWYSKEFIDPLTGQIMFDPVKLPNSKIVVDRATIKRHLVKKQEDPFDRSYLNEKMLIECPQTKQKIKQFIEQQRIQLRSTNQQNQI